MKYLLPIAVAAFFIPVIAHADVRFTEVAWMGTADSQYGEWFELYNDGDAAVPLAGWKIADGAGVAIYTLSKTIGAGDYLLVERVTASQNPYPDITDEEGTFGSGGLSNAGEDIFLKDKDGATIQELAFADGWPAGDAATKDTMQWNGSGWITAHPTPKAPAGEAISSGGDDTGGDTASDDSDDGGSEDDAGSSGSSPAKKKDPLIPAVSPNKPAISFTFPPVVYRDVPYQFVSTPVLEYNYHINHGIFYWNMGDGSYVQQEELAPVTHAYRYPGTYTVYFSYADYWHPDAPILESTKTVTVLAPKVTLSTIEDQALQLKNASGKVLNLSGWQAVSSGGAVPFSNKTVIAEGATATFPYDTLSIPHGSPVSLVDPFGRIVATTATIASAVPTASPASYGDQSPATSDDLAASASPMLSEDDKTGEKDSPQRNRTRTIVFGAVSLFVIALSLLLERFMARQE